MFDVKQELPKAPLYREEFEHDNCGIGACVNIHGEKSRATVENAPVRMRKARPVTVSVF